MAAKNKKRFTEAMLDRLRPPRSGRAEYGDEIVPGLTLVLPSAG